MLLFYHPGVWWVSRFVRREREHCCDDMAIGVCGDRATYSRMLLAIFESSTVRQPLVAANGGVLLTRIQRIVDPKRLQPPQRSVFAGAMAIAFVLTGAVCLSQSTIAEAQTFPPQAADTQSDEGAKRQAETGVLTGRFIFDGPTPQPKLFPKRYFGNRKQFEISGLIDPSLLISETGGIENVFIYVRSRDIPVIEDVSKRLPESPVVRFTNGNFQPHVLAVPVPRSLILRNEDTDGVSFHWRPIRSEAFNVIVAAGQERRVELKTAEPVPARLNSDIHPWVSSWLLATPNPYVATTAADGSFQIRNLPPGEWEFQVWHERCGNMQLADWPKGRFVFNIRPGKNDLGDIKVEPKILLNESEAVDPLTQQPSANPASQTGAEQPKPKPPTSDLDQLNDAGFSKLHNAAQGGNAKAAKALIAAGADLNVQQKTFKGAPLQYAASNGHIEVAKVLIDAGANIDSTDNIGRTPLMWAADRSQTELAKLLIDRGANVDAKTKSGWTALKYAQQRDADQIAKLLTQNSAAEAADSPEDQATGTVPVFAAMTEEDRAKLKEREQRFAKEIAFLRMPKEAQPNGVEASLGQPSGIFVPGASSTDDAWIQLISVFLGQPKTASIEAVFAVVFEDKLAGNGEKGREIGVYAIRCKDAETAEKLARPGIIRKGRLLLYVWKDDVRQAAFNSIRDYYLKKDFD